MTTVSFISTCLKAWHSQDLSTCKPLGLDASTWIAIFGALIGSLLFFGRMIVRWRRVAQSSSDYIAGSLGRSRFRNLCRSIKPIMDENYRIFFRFGPNSSRGDGLPKTVRFQLGVWYQVRRKIVDNNTRIRALITSNLSAVPLEYRPTFSRWLNHIDAFHAHVLDAAADYREHQFPQEASEIVTRYA